MCVQLGNLPVSFSTWDRSCEALESLHVQYFVNWEAVSVEEVGHEDGTFAAVKPFA